MIGSDFKPTVLIRARRCSECGRKMHVGQTYFASIKNGKIKKWVCSENCRIDFDDKFWQGVVYHNRNRRERSC